MKLLSGVTLLTFALTSSVFASENEMVDLFGGVTVSVRRGNVIEGTKIKKDPISIELNRHIEFENDPDSTAIEGGTILKEIKDGLEFRTTLFVSKNMKSGLYSIQGHCGAKGQREYSHFKVSVSLISDLKDLKIPCQRHVQGDVTYSPQVFIFGSK